MWSPFLRLQWTNSDDYTRKFNDGKCGFAMKPKHCVPVFRLPCLSTSPNIGQVIPEVVDIVERILVSDIPVLCDLKLKSSLCYVAKMGVGRDVFNDIADKVRAFGEEAAVKLAEEVELCGLVSVWKECIARVTNLQVLFAELGSSCEGSLMDWFERGLGTALARRSCLFDRITDVIVKSDKGDLAPVVGCILHMLGVVGSHKKRFEQKYIECACERFGDTLNVFDMPLNEYVDHAEKAIEMEEDCPLLSSEGQNQIRQRLSQHVLEEGGSKIRNELPNVITSCEQTMLRGIIRLHRDARRIDELLDQISEAVQDSVARALGAEHVISSLWEIVVEIRNICAELLSFTELRRIQTAFAKKLNENSQLAARIVAYDIHNAILHQPEFDAVAASRIVALLTNHSAFERTHCYLLVQRVMKVRYCLERDTALVDSLQQLLGEEANTKYRQIIHSIRKTQEIMATYQMKRNFPIRVALLPSEDVSSQSSSLSPLRFGAAIDTELATLMTHIRKQMPKRIVEWDHGMTSVSLSTGCLRVKCPAPFAAILLHLQSGAMSSKALAESMHLPVHVIEPYLHTLVAPQCAGIVRRRKDLYKLKNIAGLVEIPVTVNQNSDSDRDVIDQMMAKQREENQLDCAITSTLKSVRTILASEISVMIESKLKKGIAEEVLEARLKSLESRYLIRREGATLYYLP